MNRNINIINSACQIVREEELQLCQIVSVGGTRQAVPFTAKVLYLRESEARIAYGHGGRLLKEGGTYNDFYGYLTSLYNAIDEAKRLCECYKVGIESSLEISVSITIKETPVTMGDPPKIQYGRTEYREVSHDWMLNIPDKVEAFLHEQDHDERYEIGKDLYIARLGSSGYEKFNTDIWSSKNPDRFVVGDEGEYPAIVAWIHEQGF